MSTGSRRERLMTSATASLLSAPDTAQILRVSRATVYRLIGTGELPTHRIGGSLRVDRDELRDYIATATAATPRRYGRAAALAGTAVLLAVVGYLAAPASSTRRAPAPLADTAAGPVMSLSYPAGFEPVRAPSGLSLSDPVALGKDGRR
jgi:excisionase family DNA binding protein